jgi:hypothetical protein
MDDPFTKEKFLLRLQIIRNLESRVNEFFLKAFEFFEKFKFMI